MLAVRQRRRIFPRPASPLGVLNLSPMTRWFHFQGSQDKWGLEQSWAFKGSEKEEVHLGSGLCSCSFTMPDTHLETNGEHATAQEKPRNEYQKVNRNRIKCDTYDTKVTLILQGGFPEWLRDGNQKSVQRTPWLKKSGAVGFYCLTGNLILSGRSNLLYR